MMRTIVALAVLAAVALAVVPAADARPVPGPDDLPCDAYVSPEAGYVACCDLAHVWVSWGGTFYCA